MNYGPRSNLYHWYIFHTVTCLLAANHHYLPHHTFNPLLQQTGDLDNLTDLLGQSLEFVGQVSTLFATPVWRFLPPSGSITSVSTEGKLVSCSSHPALGVTNKVLRRAPSRLSGAVAGEAKDVFTRGVLHFLSLYFVFSLILSFSWFFLPLFKKRKKNSLVWFAVSYQTQKKLVPGLVVDVVGLLHFCQNELCWEHQVVWLH